MDPLTHAVSGALLAQATSQNAVRRRQTWLLIGLAMLPDCDIALRLVGDSLYLMHHRGVTHSLLMLPLWTWLLTALLNRSKSLLPWWMIAASIALHIGLDLITAYGTMILAPISDWRAALDLVFIIDPILTLPLVLFLIAALARPAWRRHAAATAMLFTLSYLSLTAVVHNRAQAFLNRAAPHAVERAVLPLPVSPFRWRLLARDKETWRWADVDFLPGFPGSAPLLPSSVLARINQGIGTPGDLHWRRLPTMEAALEARERTLPAVKRYRWFARFPVQTAQGKGWIEFGDLRFAVPDTEAMPFRLRLERPSGAGWLLMRDGGRGSPL